MVRISFGGVAFTGTSNAVLTKMFKSLIMRASSWKVVSGPSTPRVNIDRVFFYMKCRFGSIQRRWLKLGSSFFASSCFLNVGHIRGRLNPIVIGYDC